MVRAGRILHKVVQTTQYAFKFPLVCLEFSDFLLDPPGPCQEAFTLEVYGNQLILLGKPVELLFRGSQLLSHFPELVANVS